MCAWDFIAKKHALPPDFSSMSFPEETVAPEETFAPIDPEFSPGQKTVSQSLPPPDFNPNPPPLPAPIAEIDEAAFVPAHPERQQIIRLMVVVAIGVFLAVLTANLLMVREPEPVDSTETQATAIAPDSPPLTQRAESPASSEPASNELKDVAPPVLAEAPAPTSVEPPLKITTPPATRERPWIFEGTAYDHLTTKGVYGVKLMFIDDLGNNKARIETDDQGGFRVSLPAIASGGYTLRLEHDDYSSKYVDDLDATGGLRSADLKQRELLMKVGAAPRQWVGSQDHGTRHDLGLIRRSNGSR
mgnify:CR=1 FL=1